MPLNIQNNDGQRLQKLLAQAGLSSRRGAENLIVSGRVRVNGQKAVLGQKALPGDLITLDGHQICAEPLHYYMFHKPEGYLTTMSDPKGRPTIWPFFQKLPIRVFPVGRLDMDVSGFLVLTNDGELAKRLMHPSYLVPKVYRARVKGELNKGSLNLLASGKLIIGNKLAAPAKAVLLAHGPDQGWLELTLTEGRHRQVKRMCSAAGHPVIQLKRVGYCGLGLDPKLVPGTLRELSKKELHTLLARVNLYKPIP